MRREHPTKHVFFYLLFTFALVTTTAISKVDVIRNYNTLSNETSIRYAVIFDAGSTGSRVHVFSFDKNLNLLPVGDAIELSLKIKPGLSSFANDPEAGATSLEPLLEQAESVIPTELQPKTPMKLGATGGLRLLSEEASAQILQAVRNLFKEKSSLEYKSEWVKILDGSEEGEFMWVAINYPLGTLGKSYSHSVGIIDLGGASVQMAYAISEEQAEKAPRDENGDSSYVNTLSFNQTNYNLYVHSYLNYGLLAARAAILKAINKAGSPCILAGYNGTYTYNTVEYNASSSSSSFLKCRKAVLKALNISAPCPYKKCTFSGVWNGGGGPGQKNLYVASYFYDIAAYVGIVEKTEFTKKVKASDFGLAAQKICSMTLDEVKTNYPDVDSWNFPYLCIDLTYEYILLVDGLGIHPRREITLLTKLKYGNYFIDAAWPLGSAIEILSQESALSS